MGSEAADPRRTVHREVPRDRGRLRGQAERAATHQTGADSDPRAVAEILADLAPPAAAGTPDDPHAAIPARLVPPAAAATWVGPHAAIPARLVPPAAAIPADHPVSKIGALVLRKGKLLEITAREMIKVEATRAEAAAPLTKVEVTKAEMIRAEATRIEMINHAETDLLVTGEVRPGKTETIFLVAVVRIPTLLVSEAAARFFREEVANLTTARVRTSEPKIAFE